MTNTWRYVLCYDKKIDSTRYDACTVRVVDPAACIQLGEVRYKEQHDWHRVITVFATPAEGDGVVEVRITPNGWTADSTTWLADFVFTEVPEDYAGWKPLPAGETEITGDPEFVRYVMPPLPETR